MAQNADVVWIRLEDKPRATEFSWNMNHNLDNLAAELCKKGRLRTLKIDPSDLQFFGEYDKTHYPGSDDDGKPLRSDIQLQHLKSTAISPLIVRYPLSDKSSKSNYF